MIGDFTWGPQNKTDAVAAIAAAVDAGVNFFDTAEGYGRGESEKLLGEVLRPHRKEVVIATKVSSRHLKGDEVKRACEDSLRRLNTDYIDLYQIHWPRQDTPVDETLSAMQELQAAGKIRHIGLSNFGVSYLRELPDSAVIQSNQLCYSLLWRPIEREVLPLCEEMNMSIICYSPLCQGLLTGKFCSPDDVPSPRARTRLFADTREHARHGGAGCEAELFIAIAEIRGVCQSLGKSMAEVSLAWLLTRAGVTSVIAGARNSAQAIQNAKAGDVELPEDVIEKLSAVTEKIKDYAGSNCDLWQSESRMEK
jgi:aryl-alcohol dehydrogenase-like predicted oxidoreductase